MAEVLDIEKNNELRTIETKKDTWILELPAEICRREGYAEGTLVSLTFRDGGIQCSIIRPPSPKLQEIAKTILEENRELYEELKKLGD